MSRAAAVAAAMLGAWCAIAAGADQPGPGERRVPPPLVKLGVVDTWKTGAYFGPINNLPDTKATVERLNAMTGQCRADMKCPEGVELLRSVFGEMYRESLAHFIVYLHRENGRWQAGTPVLMFQGRDTPHLVGVTHLYVLVFADGHPRLKATATTEMRNVSSALRRQTLAIVGTFTGARGGGEEGREPETPGADGGDIAWQPLSGDPKRSDLWLGTGMVAVAPDSINHVTIAFPPVETPGADKVPAKVSGRVVVVPESSPEPEAKDFVSLSGHYSNSLAERFGVSVAAGVVLNSGGTALGSNFGSAATNGFLLGEVYLPGWAPRNNVGPQAKWPTNPSAGIAIGTSIAHDRGHEIALGFSLGHRSGPMGLFFGCVRLPGPDVPGVPTKHYYRPLAAFEYTF